LTLSLSQHEQHQHEWPTAKYVRHLTASLDFSSADRDTLQYATGLITKIAQGKGLSFRTIGQIMSNLALGMAFAPQGALRVPAIIGGLCVFKTIEPALYEKAKLGNLTFEEAALALGIFAKAKDDEHPRSEHVLKWWRYCLDRNAERSLIDELDRSLVRYVPIGSRFDIVPTVANEVIDRLQID
jgi:hypothetical protein